MAKWMARVSSGSYFYGNLLRFGVSALNCACPYFPYLQDQQKNLKLKKMPPRYSNSFGFRGGNPGKNIYMIHPKTCPPIEIEIGARDSPLLFGGIQ